MDTLPPIPHLMRLILSCVDVYQAFLSAENILETGWWAKWTECMASRETPHLIVTEVQNYKVGSAGKGNEGTTQQAGTGGPHPNSPASLLLGDFIFLNGQPSSSLRRGKSCVGPWWSRGLIMHSEVYGHDCMVLGSLGN